MEEILFGDNQFFGVNHMSLDKSVSQAQKYSNPDSVFKTLNDAREIGINTFMCTTHDGLEPVFKTIKNDKRFSEFNIIPCIPYAHKYANAVTDLGIVGAIQKYMPANILTTGLRGARILLGDDYLEIMKILVDSEMKALSGLNIGGVFLQNVVTDLLIGLGMVEFLKSFHEYVWKKYRVSVGFITMNYCKCVEVVSDTLHLDEVFICTPVNALGFRMNPNQLEVEQMLRRHKTKNIAMSVFASGFIPAEEAIKYVKAIDGIDSILFGASSRKHIMSTYNLIKN